MVLIATLDDAHCDARRCSSFQCAMMLIAQGHADTAEALLEVGADHSLCSSRGTTALHAACYYAHEAVVRVLLKGGADGTVVDAAGTKPAETFSDKVPVASRFEIKKLVRQRPVLMAEGYSELRRRYVVMWKEVEAKNMA
ncbi:hypothetical protein JKP88DRAFT_227301, partial [Tribonema minus]